MYGSRWRAFNAMGVALGIHRWCVCCFVLCRRSQRRVNSRQKIWTFSETEWSADDGVMTDARTESFPVVHVVDKQRTEFARQPAAERSGHVPDTENDTDEARRG